MPHKKSLGSAGGIVGIKNVSGGYLSVCGECNDLPGFSVDIHASGISQAGGSQWQMVSTGPGLGGILNTLTNTYLTVCGECNGLPGFSVDVHATSVDQASGSVWQFSQLGPGAFSIKNTLTNTYLSACYKCPKDPSGYSVDVHATNPSVSSYSVWGIETVVPPAPSPIPVNPPLTPLVPVPPAPTPIGPKPTPLYPPITPVNPTPTPLVPPGPAPAPEPTPLVPPSPIPLPTPFGPSHFMPVIYQSKVHPMWAFWTGIACGVLGLIGLLIGLVAGIGPLTLTGIVLVLASIAFFFVYLRY